MPLEILAMLVVALVILAVVILFFKGGMGEIGKKFGNTSKGVKDQTGDVTDEMDKAPLEIGTIAPYRYCNISKSSYCAPSGGKCIEDIKYSTLCSGGSDPGMYGCPTGQTCCCMSWGT